MNFRRYCRLAERTNNTDASQMKLNARMGLMGEMGEVVDELKKHIYQGHELNLANIKEELGDVFWYLAQYMKAENIEYDLDFVIEVELKNKYESIIDNAEQVITSKSSIVKYESLLRICRLLDLDVIEILSDNIDKLTKRYPNGFNCNDSINR